jgi:hypothetical protein
MRKEEEDTFWLQENGGNNDCDESNGKKYERAV